MSKPIIYHNPRCSKSRQTLQLLQDKGIEPIVVEYLKTPLDMATLLQLRAYFSLKDFVRTNEADFKTLGLSLDDEKAVLEAMVKAPKLMQRPIVVHKGKAEIGRPPEKVLDLF
ncbi:MAG: arsenate reductase (glutaredoxin) [Legionellaceae bacterium]|nr:arsenate reductase (glutaredoxin) [Legionellaceae bacterium]